MSLIIVKLSGGLGNQMFQYAFGLATSIKYKSSLLVDLTSFYYNKNRTYELHHFDIDIKLAHSANTYIYKSLKKILPKTLLSKTSFFPPYNNKLIKEKEIHYSPNYQSISQGYFEGYWQSEKYFKPYEKIIQEKYKFKRPITGQNLVISNAIFNEESVSLHIRRGDYITDLVNKTIYATCSLEYYEKAISYIEDHLTNPSFFIFSDDIAWAKENIKSRYKTFFVDINNIFDPSNDMRLMSLCKHNIIANSTFSWWGAWLNTNPNKIIIAPKNWFINAAIFPNDLIPETWIKL